MRNNRNGFRVIKSWRKKVRKIGNSHYLTLPPQVVAVLQLMNPNLEVRVLLTNIGILIVPEEESRSGRWSYPASANAGNASYAEQYSSASGTPKDTQNGTRGD